MRVLIADDDAARGKGIAEGCASRGHIVDRTAHGAGALELVLERVPEIVICPLELPIIGGGRLAEIVRGNPRTRRASFIFLVEDELDAPVGLDARDRVVAAPWADTDVLSQIDAILAREARYEQMQPESEVEGRLSQISLVDLLQVFHANQRSGSLRVNGAGREGQRELKGSIELQEGEIVGASVVASGGRRVVGEKALYRLLGWGEGRFEFRPGETDVSHPIGRHTRALLLEGIRQLDEWERLRPELPPLDCELALRASPENVPSIVHPIWREVLEAVALDGTLYRVVDACAAPDYQVLRSIHDLIVRGVLVAEQRDAPPPPGESLPAGELFTPIQLRRIRDWMDSQRTRPGAVLKVPVLASSPSARAGLLSAFEACGDFQRRTSLPGESRPEDLGTLGEVALAEGLRLRLVSVSPESDMAPLRAVAAHGALGTLVALGPPLLAASGRVAEAVSEVASVSERPIATLAIGSVDDSEVDAGRLRTGVEVLDRDPVLQLADGSPDQRLAILRNALSRLVP